MRSIIALLLTTIALAPALEVGEPAPPIEGVTWIKGEAPELTGSDRWTVVEFWATWCGPCRTSIPHLSKLQARYAGQIHFVGLSNEPEGTVRPFVEEQGEAMAYTVGADASGPHGSYMAGIPGIPHAFLVDPEGAVAWHGHPMQMDAILAQAVAGELDIEKLKRIAPLEKALQDALKQQDVPAIDSAADELLAVDPWHEQALQLKLAVARHLRKPAAYREVLAGLDVEAMPASLANNLAMQLATQPELQWRAIDYALKLSERAVAAEPENGANADTRARVMYLLGDIDGAIAEQERAIAEAGEDPAMAASLAYYRQVRSLGRDRAAPPRAPASGASSPSDQTDPP